jgi:hypothetical protein
MQLHLHEFCSVGSECFFLMCSVVGALQPDVAARALCFRWLPTAEAWRLWWLQVVADIRSVQLWTAIFAWDGYC